MTSLTSWPYCRRDRVFIVWQTTKGERWFSCFHTHTSGKAPSSKGSRRRRKGVHVDYRYQWPTRVAEVARGCYSSTTTWWDRGPVDSDRRSSRRHAQPHWGCKPIGGGDSPTTIWLLPCGGCPSRGLEALARRFPRGWAPPTSRSFRRGQEEQDIPFHVVGPRVGSHGGRVVGW